MDEYRHSLELTIEMCDITLMYAANFDKALVQKARELKRKTEIRLQTYDLVRQNVVPTDSH